METLSQDIAGFETGKTYQLTYRENSRGNTASSPDVDVTFDGVQIVPRHPVARTSTYTTVTSIPFTYNGDDGTGLLAISNYLAATAQTDNTALWDDFEIVEVPEPATLGLLSLGGLALLARRRK